MVKKSSYGQHLLKKGLKTNKNNCKGKQNVERTSNNQTDRFRSSCFSCSCFCYCCCFFPASVAASPPATVLTLSLSPTPTSVPDFSPAPAPDFAPEHAPIPASDPGELNCRLVNRV